MVDPALDVPVILAILSSERGSLVQHLIVIAGAVDNDVPPMFDHVLGEHPVEGDR